ncbi:MAG TPA: hypothetical protein VJT83_07555 [Chitinophagaceae bacterium]|nr:hypothetical protein [Chitinophagaceae bacterium]
MKKIAFALQVFTFTTLLPVYMIIELHQTPVANSENINNTNSSVSNYQLKENQKEEASKKTTVADYQKKN